MTQPGGSCGDCRFFLDDELVGWREREGDGECRRHPPVVQANCCNVWPRVRVGDWCGDFTRREAAIRGG